MPSASRSGVSGQEKKGSTLAELIVAFGILVPVVVVAIGIFPFSHVLNRQSWDLSAAYDIARLQLEQARSTSFDAIPASTRYAATVDGTNFTCVTTATSFSNLNPAVIKKIAVVVTWDVKRAERLELDTLVIKQETSP